MKLKRFIYLFYIITKKKKHYKTCYSYNNASIRMIKENCCIRLQLRSVFVYHWLGMVLNNILKPISKINSYPSTPNFIFIWVNETCFKKLQKLENNYFFLCRSKSIYVLQLYRSSFIYHIWIF